MNYDLNETQQGFQEQMHALCHKEITPKARLIDQGSQWVSQQLIKDNMIELGSIGYLKCLMKGGDPIQAIAAGEELAKACASTYLVADVSASMCGRVIDEVGTVLQKEMCLIGTENGSMIGSCSIGKQGDTGVVARRNGSSWCLNGNAEWMGNAPIADYFIVCAKNAESESGEMTLFLIDACSDHIALTPEYDKLGVKGYPVSGICFASCCVSHDSILGRFGEANELIARMADLKDWGLTIASLGMALASMEAAKTHYDRNRQQMTQMKEFKFADMWVLNDISRLLIQQAAWALQSSDREAKVKASCASAFTMDAASKVSSWAIELLGPDGYLNGSHAARLYRDAMYLFAGGRTSENHRDDIAEYLLRDIQ